MISRLVGPVRLRLAFAAALVLWLGGDWLGGDVDLQGGEPGDNPFSVEFTQVDNSFGGAALDGYVTNDMFASFTEQYTGAQILLDAGPGGIYQDLAGGIGPPHEAVVTFIPSLGFDTYIAQGWPTANGPYWNPSPGGGAVDLEGAASPVFSDTRLNQAFNPAGGRRILDQDDFLLGRLTLRNDVNSSVHVLVSAGGNQSKLAFSIAGGVIENGAIDISPPNLPPLPPMTPIDRPVPPKDPPRGVSRLSVDQIDNSSGGSPLEGFVTNDISAFFSGQYTGAQFLLDAGPGGIYQDPFGGVGPPTEAAVSIFPSLAFDTFVAQGGPTADGPNGNPSPGGGAVDLGGAASRVFSDNRLNQAFNPGGGSNILDQDDFLLGRITLRDDVNSSARILASAQGIVSTFDFLIEGGILIPNMISPPDVPISPPDVPISPPDVPISPPDVPISPPDVPISPPGVPTSPPMVPPNGPLLGELLRIVQIDNSAGGATLDGFVTNDISAFFAGQFTGAQILLDVGPGGIYQDAAGGIGPPNQAVVSAIPSLAFDTYIAQGSPAADGPNGDPSPGGGAVDLGADASAEFSDARLNQAFNPAGGMAILDQDDFLLGRITLRDDANGFMRFLASVGGVVNTFELLVEGGVIIGGASIPEPGSLLLGSLGFLSIFGSRRRR